MSARNDDDSDRARLRWRDSRIGVHEIQILSHGVELIIEFPWEGDNFCD